MPTQIATWSPGAAVVDPVVLAAGCRAIGTLRRDADHWSVILIDAASISSVSALPQTIDEITLLKLRGYTTDEVGFKVAAELVQDALHAIGLKSYVIELGLEFDLLILAADAGDVGLVIIAAQADIDRAELPANCAVVRID